MEKLSCLRRVLEQTWSAVYLFISLIHDSLGSSRALVRNKEKTLWILHFSNEREKKVCFIISSYLFPLPVHFIPMKLYIPPTWKKLFDAYQVWWDGDTTCPTKITIPSFLKHANYLINYSDKTRWEHLGNVYQNYYSIIHLTSSFTRARGSQWFLSKFKRGNVKGVWV